MSRTSIPLPEPPEERRRARQPRAGRRIGIAWIPVLTFLSALACADRPDPGADFAAGSRLRWDSSGHPRAAGIRMTIEYPADWASAPEENPVLLQRFMSEGGDGLEACMVGAKPFAAVRGRRLTRAELAEIIAQDPGMNLAPVAREIRAAGPGTIGGLPASVVRFQGEVERKGVRVQLEAVVRSTICAGSVVVLECMVMDVSGASGEDLLARYRDYEPLFERIFASVTFDDCVVEDRESRPRAAGIGGPGGPPVGSPAAGPRPTRSRAHR